MPISQDNSKFCVLTQLPAPKMTTPAEERDKFLVAGSRGHCQMSSFYSHNSSWPVQWDTLRAQGRLQWRRMQASGMWYAVIPELGIEVRAREARQLIERLAPHLAKLPHTQEQQRVNGFPWPEPLPASRNLLPKR